MCYNSDVFIFRTLVAQRIDGKTIFPFFHGFTRVAWADPSIPAKEKISKAYIVVKSRVREQVRSGNDVVV
jgi:hypothetical protein